MSSEGVSKDIYYSFYRKIFVGNKNLGLDQDWILIQQQHGSGSGFSKMRRSRTGPDNVVGSHFTFRAFLTVKHL
jgi:hypothetical protein